MGRNCALCNIKQTKSSAVVMHRFPKNVELCQIWKDICGYDDQDNVSTLCICSKHFKLSDYQNYRAKHLGNQMILCPGSYPSIAVPNPRKENVSFDVSYSLTNDRNFAIQQKEEILSSTSSKFTVQVLDPLENIECVLSPKSEPSDNLENGCVLSPKLEPPETPPENIENECVLSPKLEPPDTPTDNSENECYLSPKCEPSETSENNYFSSQESRIFAEPLENPSDDTEMECDLSSKKRRFFEPRYLSEATEEDILSPSRAKRVLKLAKSTALKQTKEIATLKQKFRRLSKRLLNLKSIVSIMRHKNMITEDADHELLKSIDKIIYSIK